jgi:hypothetical protein
MRKSTILFMAALICAGAGFQVSSLAQTIIKGTDFVCNGESFFQASNICSELSRLAKADGYLAQGDNFKQIAVSGAPIANIVNFYKNCTPKPTYLVSDGAGIDLMSSNNISGLSNTLKTYLDEMKKGGTKKLLWMIYPDPQGSNWATLKKNQDLWAQAVPPIINGCTDPQTLLVDLRPVWAGKYSQYTSDGIHATSAGGTATAEAFWKAIKAAPNWLPGSSNISYTIVKTRPSAVLEKSVSSSSIFLSLFLAQPTAVNMRIMTISGKTVATVSQQEQFSGTRNIAFPIGGIVPGVYCLDVQAGQFLERSSLVVP